MASMGTLAGTLTETAPAPTIEDEADLVGIAESGMELARGIEPPTCGLQIATDPCSLPSSLSPEATESQVEWPG